MLMPERHIQNNNNNKTKLCITLSELECLWGLC